MSDMEKPEAYAAFLTKCETLNQLHAHVCAYDPLTIDAVRIVEKMTDDEFTEFRRGLKLERAGTFAGVEWCKRFAAVLMPEPMFTVARIAHEYNVPFNVALIRIRDVRPELLDVSREQE